MTRKEKVLSWLIETVASYGNVQGMRWCEADVCGCLGCINGSYSSVWKEMFPDDTFPTKEEYEEARKLKTLARRL